MPSPFPGMDPYLEDPDRWADFHLTVIVAMRAALNATMPRGYLASADRHVWVDDPRTVRRKSREPDVLIVPGNRTPSASPSGAGLLTSPRTVTLPRTEHKGKPYLKIVDKQERRLVTVIEFLSPANKKAGKDRNAYLTKREEYLAARVNLVEFNLLRRGVNPPFWDESLTENDYYVLSVRAADLPNASLWPFSVRDKFPDIVVPLRGRDSVIFNLRPCLERAFEEARYADEIDYGRPPNPPLAEPDASWARNLLRKSPRS